MEVANGLSSIALICHKTGEFLPKETDKPGNNILHHPDMPL